MNKLETLIAEIDEKYDRATPVTWAHAIIADKFSEVDADFLSTLISSYPELRAYALAGAKLAEAVDALKIKDGQDRASVRVLVAEYKKAIENQV